MNHHQDVNVTSIPLEVAEHGGAVDIHSDQRVRSRCGELMSEVTHEALDVIRHGALHAHSLPYGP